MHVHTLKNYNKSNYKFYQSENSEILYVILIWK